MNCRCPRDALDGFDQGLGHTTWTIHKSNLSFQSTGQVWSSNLAGGFYGLKKKWRISGNTFRDPDACFLTLRRSHWRLSRFHLKSSQLIVVDQRSINTQLLLENDLCISFYLACLRIACKTLLISSRFLLALMWDPILFFKNLRHRLSLEIRNNSMARFS